MYYLYHDLFYLFNPMCNTVLFKFKLLFLKFKFKLLFLLAMRNVQIFNIFSWFVQSNRKFLWLMNEMGLMKNEF